MLNLSYFQPKFNIKYRLCNNIKRLLKKNPFKYIGFLYLLDGKNLIILNVCFTYLGWTSCQFVHNNKKLVLLIACILVLIYLISGLVQNYGRAWLVVIQNNTAVPNYKGPIPNLLKEVRF